MKGISNGNELQGRTAIITGASQGLGLEIAMRYVAAGASVIIVPGMKVCCPRLQMC